MTFRLNSPSLALTFLAIPVLVVPLTQPRLMAAPDTPSAMVIVSVAEKDFVSRSGLRLVRRNITVEGFDMKAAFQDELMNTLAQDKRMSWRLADAGEATLYELILRCLAGPCPTPKKPTIPADAKADRFLLVDLDAFGSTEMAGFTYYNIVGRISLIDRSGKRLWSEFNRIGDSQGDYQVRVHGSVISHQADNQKVFKENLNKVIEVYCRNKVKDLVNKNLGK